MDENCPFVVLCRAMKGTIEVSFEKERKKYPTKKEDLFQGNESVFQGKGRDI